MNIPAIVETIIQDGLLKYKFRNSKIKPFTITPQKSKGAIFAYRSKESMIGGRGVVVTSEEAIQENKDKFTHWTPNVYRYGTYADQNRAYTKGHFEKNLKQINTFFIDFDVHSAEEAITTSDILTTAMDLGYMPTMIIKTDKGFQAYFVLACPVFITAKTNFKAVQAAKMISENLRDYFGRTLPVDKTCNHFGIARAPRTDNVEFFNADYRYNFSTWQNWSYKYSDDRGKIRPNLTVLSGTEGKKQTDEPWFSLLLHETKFEGKKGLVGRNNVMFTLALAYYSSGYSQETCEYNLFEFNERLQNALDDKEILKIIKSAYSQKYQAASREYVLLLCKQWVSQKLTEKELFSRQGWYKFKKRRSERKRVHLSEWKEDLLAYLRSKTKDNDVYLETTKKEIREALRIPERSLDKLLKLLKARQEILFTVKHGRSGGIRIARMKDVVSSILVRRKEAKERSIEALRAVFGVTEETIKRIITNKTNPQTIRIEDILGELDSG